MRRTLSSALAMLQLPRAPCNRQLRITRKDYRCFGRRATRRAASARSSDSLRSL
jgi:hypothetical protein